MPDSPDKGFRIFTNLSGLKIHYKAKIRIFALSHTGASVSLVPLAIG